jgi:hypothetical protein
MMKLSEEKKKRIECMSETERHGGLIGIEMMMIDEHKKKRN